MPHKISCKIKKYDGWIVLTPEERIARYAEEFRKHFSATRINRFKKSVDKPKSLEYTD